MFQSNLQFEMQTELYMLCPMKKKTTYVSYKLCPVLEKYFSKPATYILQQLHYWLLLEDPSLGLIHDDRQWFYNSHEQWVTCFKKNRIYLSRSSVRRGLDDLEQTGILLMRRFAKPGNKINSYTINYDQLEKSVGAISATLLQKRPGNVAKDVSLDPHHDIVEKEEAAASGITYSVQTLHESLSNNEHNSAQRITFMSAHCRPTSVQMNTPGSAQMSTCIYRYTTSLKTTNLSSEQSGERASLLASSEPHNQQERKNLMISYEMIRLWNDVIEQKSAPVSFTEQRSRYLMAAFKQFFNADLDQWSAFCRKIASSKFLMGETSASKWRIDLDWALNFDKLRLICEGKRYTFGDRVVADHISNSTINVSGDLLKQRETPDALMIRARIQARLRTHYDDHQGALYMSWFDDTYLDVEENQNHEKKVYLYVKLRFIKEQIPIRFRDLCETLIDEICVGFPEIQYLGAACSQSSDAQFTHSPCDHQQSNNAGTRDVMPLFSEKNPASFFEHEVINDGLNVYYHPKMCCDPSMMPEQKFNTSILNIQNTY